MNEVKIKEVVRGFIREMFKQTLSEASYELGKKSYTDKNMTPTEILDLAMAYSKTSANQMLKGKLGNMVNVANDLAKLTGTTQQDAKTRGKQPALIIHLLKNGLLSKDEYVNLYKDLISKQISVIKSLKNADPASRMVGGAAARQAHKDMKGEFEESVSEVKYPTDLKIGSVVMGQGFTRLKGIDGGKYYKIVAMDDTTATLVPSDKSGNVKGSSKVRHKLDSIEGGIKTAKRGDENGIVVIKESVNEMSVNDVHFKQILRMYDHGGSFTKKKVAVVVCKNPRASRKDIIDAMLDMDYDEITDVQDELGIKESVNEAKPKYEVYHKSYTSAIQAALDYAKKEGYDYDEEETADKIGLGPKKPSEGKTNKFHLSLTKNFKPQKKMLHIQVYGMKNSYELNAYIQ